MTSILAESLGILWSGGRGKQKNKNKEQNGGDKWEIVYWGGGAFRGRAELVSGPIHGARLAHRVIAQHGDLVAAEHPTTGVSLRDVDGLLAGQAYRELDG